MHYRTILMIVLVTSAAGACDKAEGGAEAKTPKPSKVEAKIEKGVDDLKNEKGAKWKISYEGDLEGEIEGGVLVALGSDNIQVKGKALKDDRRGSAERDFRATILRYTDTPKGNMKLTLEDGTSCKEADISKGSKVDLKSDDPLRATLTGSLVCGEKGSEKSITYRAELNE